MAKFAANNHINASTEITLFFADNDFHSRTDIESLQTSQKYSRKAKLLAADKIVKNQKNGIVSAGLADLDTARSNPLG